jgi:formylglycine-generating enzyme required for sulfatase activity
MTTRVETGGGAAVGGDLDTRGGAFVGRDQINLIGAVSAEQLEAVLPLLQGLLARRDTELSPEPEHQRLRLTNPDGATILLGPEAAEALLPAAARQGDPAAYLSALLVHPRYGRWAERYVPLAGALTETRRPAGWSDIAPEFTALETQGEGAQRQIRRVRLADVTEAVARHDTWVLLGEPGSGKTTTLQRLLIDLARARLQTGRGRLPLLLELADYGGYASPQAFVEALWRQRLGAGDLERELRAGGLFLLCDALNEMPFADAAEYRQRIGAWRRFVQAWPGNRLVFTCRSRDYGEPMGLPQVEIERLDDRRVQDFLGRYLSPDLAAEAWGRLAASPLLALVRNPFYLYILCWLVAEGEAWPAGRAGLFQGFVGRLLARERRRGHPDWPGEGVLGVALARLAEGLQRIGEGTRLPRAEALERLPLQVAGPDGLVDTEPQALLRLGLAATLLDTELDPARGEQIRFYHHQLQEYFAARALLAAFRRGEDLAARWRCPRLKGEMPDPGPLRKAEPLPPPPTTGWEEPTLMAAGLPEGGADLLAAVRAVNPALAARCLAEPGVASTPEERAATRQALLGDLEGPEVHLRARLAAGRALGRLGDPRFEALELDGLRVLLPPLVEIPAGEVTLGSSRLEVWRLSRRGFPAGDERPRHRVRLPGFAIGRYPVTHAEFGCFVADGGYGEARWWDTRAWRRGELQALYVEDWLNHWWTVRAYPSSMQGQGWSAYNIARWRKVLEMSEDEVRAALEKEGADRPMDRPAYWTDERFDNPSQPVVGVTWFEARAYCNWLTARWREAGARAPRPLPENARFSLPTEAEWERAARPPERRPSLPLGQPLAPRLRQHGGGAGADHHPRGDLSGRGERRGHPGPGGQCLGLVHEPVPGLPDPGRGRPRRSRDHGPLCRARRLLGQRSEERALR